MKYRAGSDKDAFLLESAAISLGFEHVRIIHNATKFEIMQWIYTCKFAIVFSSFQLKAKKILCKYDFVSDRNSSTFSLNLVSFQG